jgi:hypothetical protein
VWRCFCLCTIRTRRTRKEEEEREIDRERVSRKKMGEAEYEGGTLVGLTGRYEAVY